MTCHAHKCKKCGHEWCHSDKWAAEASSADYKKGHTCTECGQEQRNRSAIGLRSCDKLPILEPANRSKRYKDEMPSIAAVLAFLDLMYGEDLATK